MGRTSAGAIGLRNPRLFFVFLAVFRALRAGRALFSYVSLLSSLACRGVLRILPLLGLLLALRLILHLGPECLLAV